MLKMVIVLDEHKVIEDNRTVKDCYEHLNEKFRRRNLKVCEDGVYTDKGDEDDLFQFMVLISAFSKFEWFVRYVKSWLWYEDCDEPEDLIQAFELEKRYDYDGF